MEKRCINKRIGSISALLITTVLSGTHCKTKVQPGVLSFPKNVQEQSNKPTFLKEQDVLLLCETEGYSNIQIGILGDEHQLNVSQGTQKSLTYLIKSVTCDDTKTYECFVNNKERRTNDLIVSNCPPLPCQPDDVNITLFVPFDQTVQFSFCVMVYPDIFENVQINKTHVRKKAPSNGTWSWDYQEITSSHRVIKTFKISISRDHMVKEEYGLLNIRVCSRIGTQSCLDYVIWLEPPGPPECPVNVNVTDHGPHDVSLSWTPGSDGGSEQSFHVYSSTDNVTWNRHDVASKTHITNITGLGEDTTFSFRVVSSNMYRKDVNETVCEKTVFVKTDSFIPETTDTSVSKSTDTLDSTIKHILLPVSVSITVVLLLLAGCLCILKVRKHRQTRRGKSDNARMHNSQQLAVCDGRQQDSGEHISEDGLKYVTVYHIRGMIKKKKFGEKKKRKKDKVLYADLDFIKSGRTEFQQEG